MRLDLAIMVALLPVSIAVAADNPTLDDDVLTIPSIDTPQQVGQYRNATFKRNEDSDKWTLLTSTETQSATVENVDVITIPSRPVQIFLKASGYLPSPCHSVELAGQRFSPLFGIPELDLPEGRFEVALAAVQLQTFVPCAQVIEPFDLTIPLPVYGLRRGTYEFDVNGIAGSFYLNVDNNLPADANLKVDIPWYR